MRSRDLINLLLQGAMNKLKQRTFLKRYQELKELLNEEMEKWEQYTDEVEVFLKNNS